MKMILLLILSLLIIIININTPAPEPWPRSSAQYLPVSSVQSSLYTSGLLLSTPKTAWPGPPASGCGGEALYCL